MDNNNNNKNFSSQILEENSQQNQNELDNNNESNENDIEKNNNYSINENSELKQEKSSSLYLKDQNNSNINFSISTRVRPKMIRLSQKIFYDLSLCQNILNYLNIFELNNMRRMSHKILSLVHEYYKKRIKMQIIYITDYQEKNRNIIYSFMKIIDTQIPISNKNWLDFDLNSVVNKLNTLNRNIIFKLRSIKNTDKISDFVFAPFCIIVLCDERMQKMKKFKKITTWKNLANKILYDNNIILKIKNIDIENLNDAKMLEAFKYLNMPELEIDKLKKHSLDLSKLISWCQAVVSYHIIIHPYIYRNKNKKIVQQDNDKAIKFINEIENMLEKFYKFKRFLYNLNIMKIPLGDYVFNLQHNINIGSDELNISNYSYNINYIDKLDISIISNILSYIPFKKSYKMMIVCKKFYEGFKSSIDVIIFEMIKEIYFFRYQSYHKIKNEIPEIFSYNFFSKFFLMIDDILNSNIINTNEFGINYYPFLSKEQLTNIKLIKLKNKYIEDISKIFCLICDIKPLKILNKKTVKFEYNYTDNIKSLVLKGELLQLMRNYNKLFFNRKKIKQFSEDIKVYASNQKLAEIKKINKGIYQLLIWELFILHYLKVYNVFDFSNMEIVQKIYRRRELESIHYYIEIMNYLKYYLKIKFHFSGGNKLSLNKNKNFDFFKHIKKLNKFLKEKNLSNNNQSILESTNYEWEKIGKAYFESKNQIPFHAKPIFYERIMIEILEIKESKDNSFYSISNSSNMSNYNKEINNIINANKNKIGISRPLIESKDNKNKSVINIKNKSSKIEFNKNKSNTINFNKNQILNINDIFSNLKISFSLISEDIFIKYIFFYLDIYSLPTISLINHKFLAMIKTHLFIRVFLLKKEKKYIEEQKKEIFNIISNKRKMFFTQYEIKEPTKEHALNLINQMKEKDFFELRQYYKKYNEKYEKLIIPFLLLLNEKPQSNITPKGTKTLSYFNTAKKLFFHPDYIKKIKEIELELIPYKIFKKVEKLMTDEIFSVKNAKKTSPCFYKLINWILGVLEFHRAIRKYSLSEYDFDILNKDEIDFCIRMDNIIVLYYKLNRYIANYCQEYEADSKLIMKDMGLIN